MNQAAPPKLPTVTGRLEEKSDDQIVLHVLGSDYRLHLVTEGPVDAEVGDRITGTIHLHPRRVDVFPSGGRFVEPVFGRPRRMQGRVAGGDVSANTLFVQCGPGVIAHLMASQKASDFAIGQIVGADVQRGATFQLVEKS
ncbi:hypothetical protein ACERK3_04130 [Phycisphaerales bacterium AB-hyl4]|uniref:TOBE domain-containing protein n=1 Tax=Natronomicrosphaera hydrolytica TaxID=3242702 RepID=A0ABV4U3Q1_9BACT